MNESADILFEYLRDIFYNPSTAALDIDRLDEDFVMLGKGLMYLAQCFAQYNELAMALANGDLSAPLPPPENELAAPLKSLQASLKHLSWQSQQVAKGDYMQRVDFMGDFSIAFNTMIEQLAQRQQKLEDEIELSRRKTLALEQSNQLLSNITQNVPQQIIVTEAHTGNILFLNNSACFAIDSDPDYISKLRDMAELDGAESADNVEIEYGEGDSTGYLSVSSYALEWNKTMARAFVINDISAEKSQIKELETYAYRDNMTRLHNRFYGMLELDKWLEEKRRFSLTFVDLDYLKLINDKFGHSEGDHYIMTVADYLRSFSPEALPCRIGGDEFMLLIPDIGYDETLIRMEELCKKISRDEYLDGKDFVYSISFGVVSTDDGDDMTASDILSKADERMYENKRWKKKNRQL